MLENLTRQLALASSSVELNILHTEQSR